MNRTYLFLVLFSFLSFSLLAQTDDNIIGFRITKIEKKGAQKWLITLDHGSDVGLKTDEAGSVWGIVRPQIENHNVKLGDAVLKSVATHEAKAEVETDKTIFEGDLLFINAALPARSSRSPYFQLVVFGISITDQQGNLYYTPDEVFEKDGYPFRTAKFLVMKAEINFVGKQLGQRGDTTKVEAGPNRGKLVSQIMLESDTLAVWYYVYHLAQINDVTMGQTIKLGDGYFAYAREGDAASLTILKNLFLDNGRDIWDQKFDEYKRKLPVEWAIGRKNDAMELRKKEEYENAHKLHDISIFIAGRNSDSSILADCIFEKAETFLAEKKYDVAVEQYTRARDLYSRLKNELVMGRCDLKIGYVLRTERRMDEAWRVYTRVEKLLKERIKKEPQQDYDDVVYRVHTGMADISIEKRNFEQARLYYQANVELSAQYKYTTGLAESNWGIAITWNNEKRYAQAIPYYEKSGKFYLEAGDTTDALDAVEGNANALENLKEYQKALTEFQAGVMLASGKDFWIMKAKLLRALGRVFRKMGKWDQALKSLGEALSVCREMKDNLSQSSVLKEMAAVYEDKKNFVEAVNTHLARLPVLQDGSVTLRADVYWDIAYMNTESQKDYQSAITYYKKAIELYSQSTDTTDWKTVLSNLGAAYRYAGDSVNAYKTHRVAIDLTLKNSDPTNLSYAYEKAAETYGYFKKYERKIDLLKKALPVYQLRGDHTKIGEINKSIAKVYEEGLKDFKMADKFFLTSIEHYDQSDDPVAKADAYWSYAYNIGQEEKDYRTAIVQYNKSLAIYSQGTDTTNWKSILASLGVMYEFLNDSSNAYRYYQLAIDLTLKNSDPANLLYAYEKAAGGFGTFKNYRRKMAILKKELAICQLQGDHAKVGELSKSIAKILEDDLKDYETANHYFLQAIEHYNQTDLYALRGDTYWSYAYNVGVNQKGDKDAIPLYELAYGLYLQAKDTSDASVVRSNVGQSYWAINNFDKAIEAHKEAIYLANRSRNQQQIFKSWSALADLYKNTQNPVASAEALKNAASAAEKLSDSTLLASTYFDLAGSYSKSKDYLQAFHFYEKSLSLRKMLKDSLNMATTLASIGSMYHTRNEYVKAKDYYLQSLDLRKKIKDKPGSIYTLADLGSIVQFIDANYQRAEALFLEAIQIGKDFKDDYGLAFCYERLSYMYRAEGKSDLALQYKQMAEGMYRESKNWKALAELTIVKGFDTFYYYGDQNKALQILDQAQGMQDTLNDKTIQAEIYNVRASVLREMGEFDKALDYTDKSVKLYQEVDNGWGILGSYVVKGNIYKQRGEYETALRFQFKADSMYKQFNNEYSRYVTFTNIGENYAAQGDYKKALEYYHKANAIFIKANDLNDDVASIQGLIGQSYFYENDFVAADKWLKESLVTSDKAGSFRAKMENLSNLGRLKIAEKKYDEAEKYLSQGLKLSKEKANTLTYLSNLVLIGKLEVEQKHFDKGKAPLEESLKMSRNIGKNATLWESLYLLGVIYKNTGDLTKSKDFLKEAVSVIEKLRNNVSGGAEAQKVFSSDKNILNVYDALIEVLLALGETEEAMTYLQKNNEDNLKSKFKALDMKFENESKNKAMAEERNKKAKLDGIEAQIAAEKVLAAEKQNTEKLKNLEGIKTIAENEYLKFINQQINVQPELSKFFNNSIQPTQFRKIKKQIPKDMALVSYLAGENQLYIFAATADTVIAKIVTVTREQLTRDINAMLNIVRSSLGTFAAINLQSEVAERTEIVMDMKQTDKSIKPFEDAYHYLIAPVSKEIAGKSRLCIIPTGALNYIPFQLLGKTLANGKFSLLMNQFSIFYANSTDMLFREKNVNDKKYHILAFGNPDKSLPSTEKEVNDIKKMFPSASIFLREDATEDKVKDASESFNVMHFATHGNLDYEDFSKSYLTMASNVAKSEDGKLTLEELWGMEVMNHLNIVVLSACQTAVTKGSNESSPVSPASGFLQNGVKSVVATLWKVDDEATSMLMSDFYNNIKTMDAVDALRASQNKLSATTKFNHPYFWAAFVLMGDWR